MGKKYKILMFVEDEQDIVELYKIVFESAGFLVRGLATGEEALEVVRKLIEEKIDSPSAIILDILLPGISGMDILKEIRKHKKLDMIPVVMFTNYSSEEFMKEARKMKNTSYVLKTEVTPVELVEIVREKIKQSEIEYAE